MEWYLETENNFRKDLVAVTYKNLRTSGEYSHVRLVTSSITGHFLFLVNYLPKKRERGPSIKTVYKVFSGSF